MQEAAQHSFAPHVAQAKRKRTFADFLTEAIYMGTNQSGKFVPYAVMSMLITICLVIAGQWIQMSNNNTRLTTQITDLKEMMLLSQQHNKEMMDEKQHQIENRQQELEKATKESVYLSQQIRVEIARAGIKIKD